MKHSTFRKGSLISSVALLLVAIVALSGATFAWFSTNNTASAGTVEMTATSASGLYISNDDTLASTAPAADAKWSSKITWEDNAEAMPAVSGNASSLNAFFKTSTDNADGTWNGTDTISAAEANKDFIVKKIWVKADSNEDVNLTITPTVGGDNKGYERLAIVDPDGKVTIMDNAGDSYGAFTNQQGTTTPITADTYGDVTYEGKLDTAKAFYVYMWFEGQDAQCKNTNSGANMTIDLGFAI